MNVEQSRVIAAVLANDENSTDAELLEYFQCELGLSATEATGCISRRDSFLKGETK